MSSVGADIESLCRKCGDVWHVVVAMEGEVVAKVQCKQCGGYHRHRAPGSVKKPAAARKPRASARGESSTRAPSVPVIDLNKPTRPYHMADTFQVGEQVQHLRFGVGVVESAEPGKVTIFFNEGRRVLAAARTESRLESANSMRRIEMTRPDEVEATPTSSLDTVE